MNKTGFTLAELMIVVAIMAISIIGLLKLYIFTTVEAQMSGNKTLAITEAQGKLEEMRMQDFDTIVGTYDKKTSTMSLLDGVMFVDISDANPELLEITIVPSWTDRYGRQIGERDSNNNGVVDPSEDLNGDGQFSSPVVLKSMITRR